MSNYYEVLKLTPTAAAAEIETACEAQYNRWRRLVTHHDPETADKATRALRILEQIRATLTDPAKRAAYDATLDLSGTVSGLVDPQAQPARPVAPPLPPRPPSVPQATPQAAPTARMDAWQCPKCHSANPVGTRYCRHCGDEIGRDCPKCGKLIEKTIRFCPECGVEVETYIEAKRREAEALFLRQQQEARRQAEERARREAQEREQRQRRNRTIGVVAGLLALVVIGGMIISGISQAARQRQYQMQATATAEQHKANATATVVRRYENATATAEAFIASGGLIDDKGHFMAFVPAGAFMMGSNDGEVDEKPVHRVELDAFWIDVYEVTYGQYTDCSPGGFCGTPEIRSCYADDSNPNCPVLVDWYDAKGYCSWRGGAFTYRSRMGICRPRA